MLLKPNLVAPRAYFVIFILLFGLNANVFSQKESNSARSELKHWTIAAKIAVLHAYTSENPTQNSRFSESPYISLEYGLTAGYKINRNFSLKTGLFYTNIKQNITQVNNKVYTENGGDASVPNRFTNFYQVDFNTSYGSFRINTTVTDDKIGDGNDYSEGDLIGFGLYGIPTLEYFSIPVLASYAVLKRPEYKFNFELIGGFIAAFSMSSKLDLESYRNLGFGINDTRRYRDSSDRYRRRIYPISSEFGLVQNPIRNANVGFEVGVNLNGKLAGPVDIIFQASYASFLLPLTTVESYKIYQKSFKFLLGFGYNF